MTSVLTQRTRGQFLPAPRSLGATRTFGEAVQARLGVANTVQRLIDVAVALTLIVAGCSLAVTIGGGLVERKRPFTMLRLTGTSTATLYRVVLSEAVLPLVAAAGRPSLEFGSEGRRSVVRRRSHRQF